MLAVSSSAKRLPVTHASQQDTGAQRQHWVGDINQPEVTVLSSGSFVSVEGVTGNVTYTQIATPVFSVPNWQFHRLTEQWKRERGAESSVTKIAMCPSYQKITAMGPAVVPMILRQLEIEGDEPDHWFWALSAIHPDADPIPHEARGDMVQMAQAWLAWGRQRYAW